MADVKPVWIFVAGLVLLFVFLIAFAFRTPTALGPGGMRRYAPQLGPGGTRRYAPMLGPGGTYHPFEGFTNGGSAGEPSTLYMIGVDWCPHCRNAKPGFTGLGATRTIDGHPVAFQYLDGEKEKDQVPKDCEVGGYPTFCFLHKGKTHRYGGPRSPEGYTDFVQKVIGSGSA
jgi:hypothetical protein